jgi:hypothetical protein
MDIDKKLVAEYVAASEELLHATDNLNGAQVAYQQAGVRKAETANALINDIETRFIVERAAHRVDEILGDDQQARDLLAASVLDQVRPERVERMVLDETGAHPETTTDPGGEPGTVMREVEFRSKADQTKPVPDEEVPF